MARMVLPGRVAFTDVSKRGTIQLPHTQSDYAEQIDAERTKDNTGKTRCGIVRHSTLWLMPVPAGQFEFCGADARRSSADPRADELTR